MLWWVRLSEELGLALGTTAGALRFVARSCSCFEAPLSQRLFLQPLLAVLREACCPGRFAREFEDNEFVISVNMR